jgi:hypothetical protein
LLIALTAFEFALDSRASVAYISLRALPPGVCLIPPDLFSVPVIFVTTDVLGQLPPDALLASGPPTCAPLFATFTSKPKPACHAFSFLAAAARFDPCWHARCLGESFGHQVVSVA